MTTKLLTKLRGNAFSDTWKLYEYSRMAASIAKHLQGTRTLVDLGCAEGLFTRQLKVRLPEVTSVLAVDLLADDSWSDPTPGIRFAVGDASSPPIGPDRPDAVVAKDLLHHMDDPDAGVRAIVRTALQRAVIIEANRENPVMDMYTRFNGDRHFTSAELAQLLRRASPTVGWQFSSLVAYPFYLPPVKTAAALWVWPLTAVMLVAFKVAHSKAMARALSRSLVRLKWPAPYTVAVADFSSRTKATSNG